jgi:hypothetical protein
MLNRKGRKCRQSLKALTDPQPEFVSLVFGGANKTPFRAIRADGAAVGEEEVTVKENSHSIARVEFSGAKFADEAAVKSWLISGGYDPAMPITKTDAGFMVDSNVDPETVLTVIDMADTQGVKVFTIATKADDTLELTQEVHPGALLSLTMGLYDSVRKSMGKGEYDVGGQVDDYVSALKALTETLPEKTDENFAAVVSTVAP